MRFAMRKDLGQGKGRCGSGTLGRLDISRGRILVPFDPLARGLRKAVPLWVPEGWDIPGPLRSKEA